MSISSNSRKAGPYSGNDVATAFAFAFKVFATADVLVVFTALTGVETVLALGAEYTVALSANQDTNPGGTVTLPTALAAGTKLTLTSAVANLQPVTLANQGGFYPKVINDALDRTTIQIQQLAEEVGRAFKLPISSTVTPSDTLAGYMVQAKESADQSVAASVDSAASAVAASGFSNVAKDFATASALSATASATSAISASAAIDAASSSAVASIASQASNVVSAAIAYVDSKFIPGMSFSSMYLIGGWDLGGLTVSPFYNETASRRANLSVGSGTFNFGSLS